MAEPRLEPHPPMPRSPPGFLPPNQLTETLQDLGTSLFVSKEECGHCRGDFFSIGGLSVNWFAPKSSALREIPPEQKR